MGGACQGKLAHALERYGVDRASVGDGETGDSAGVLEAPIVYRLHRLVRRLLDDGQDASAVVLGALAGRRDWIVICDEVGCGVVPLEAAERSWREETGRICQALAAQADVVERVQCGLALRIKGGTADADPFR